MIIILRKKNSYTKIIMNHYFISSTNYIRASSLEACCSWLIFPDKWTDA